MVRSQISSELLLIIYVIIFAAAYYFLLVLPQRRRAQERQKLVESLKVNSEVITIGGIIGTVKRIEEDIVYLEVADKVTLRITKDAIGAVIEERKEV